MLDQRNFRQDRTYGDIASYVSFQGGQRYLILKATQHATGRPVAFPEQYAHLYANADGSPTEYLIQMAAVYAAALGYMQTDSYAAQKIIDIVLDRLPELIEVAPVEFVKPQKDGVEYTVRVDGEIAGQGEF